MTTASDDILAQPLGVAPKRARPAWTRLLHPTPILGAVLAVVLGSLGGWISFVRDPLGGQPFIVAPITVRAPMPVPMKPAAPAPGNGRHSADEIENASGVSVVRPQGAGAPSAVVIQVPSDETPRLAPAPDPRLVERGRYGTLPKLGAGGVRPLDVYARPEAATLPGGAAPAGRVAIVLTGLGIGQAATADAIAKLPPPVSLAFAPYGGDLEKSAARARDAGHEVLLQVPMEPFDYPDNDPGPQTLVASAAAPQNLDRLTWALSRFTGYLGVVNYMGARLTSEAGAMEPVLRELAARGLGYLDDGTSPRSLAAALGAKTRTPVARADAVLDAVPRPDAIDRELARLEETARRSGFALGSATALPLTIDRVARWSRELAARGILLVPASRALRSPR